MGSGRNDRPAGRPGDDPQVGAVSGDTPSGGERAEAQLGFTPKDLRLVMMMISGLKDETASSELGISPRSYRRHYDRLAEMVGAKSRAHFGYRIRDLIPSLPADPGSLSRAQIRPKTPETGDAG